MKTLVDMDGIVHALEPMPDDDLWTLCGRNYTMDAMTAESGTPTCLACIADPVFVRFTTKVEVGVSVVNMKSLSKLKFDP